MGLGRGGGVPKKSSDNVEGHGQANRFRRRARPRNRRYEYDSEYHLAPKCPRRGDPEVSLARFLRGTLTPVGHATPPSPRGRQLRRGIRDNQRASAEVGIASSPSRPPGALVGCSCSRNRAVLRFRTLAPRPIWFSSVGSGIIIVFCSRWASYVSRLTRPCAFQAW